MRPDPKAATMTASQGEMASKMSLGGAVARSGLISERHPESFLVIAKLGNNFRGSLLCHRGGEKEEVGK